MKVVLYIGHHKVGSTALQAYLSQNWLALAQSGILYPAVEAEGIASNLKRGLAGADCAEIPRINIREPHNALAFRMMSEVTGNTMPPYHKNLPAVPQMLKTLRAQVAQIAPHTVILCSEVMSNFARVRPAMIERIATLFPNAEIELYCALRRPDHYLASWHGQRLKFGQQIAPLRNGGGLKYKNSIHFDYQFMLTPWLNQFPEAKVHLRNYADVLAAGGSVEDFIRCLDVDFPTGLQQSPRRNPSLPYAIYEIMCQANQVLDRPDSKTLRDYIMSAPEISKLPRNSEVELFGAQQRNRLAEAFAPVADFLAPFAKGDAFFPDLALMRDPHPRSEAEILPESFATLNRNRILQKMRLPAPVRAFLKGFDPHSLPTGVAIQS